MAERILGFYTSEMRATLTNAYKKIDAIRTLADNLRNIQDVLDNPPKIMPNLESYADEAVAQLAQIKQIENKEIDEAIALFTHFKAQVKKRNIELGIYS